MNLEIYKRILSSIILIPVGFFFILKGSIIFNFFLLACFLLSVFEWYSMSKKKNYHIFGYIFLIFSFYSIFYLRNNFSENSLFVFLFIITICISTDIGGYISGKVFKGPRLTKISPNKTYSGVFGSFIFSIFFINILINYSYLFKYKNLSFGSNELIFVLIISAVSQIGDVIISYFKRLSKIKDTGNLIPGHGGILDRIDGMLFAFPLSLSYLLINNFFE